jgi:hypothetical protein
MWQTHPEWATEIFILLSHSLQQSNSFNPPHSESAITVVRFQLASKTISSSDQTWSANPAAIAGASCGFWRNCSAWSDAGVELSRKPPAASHLAAVIDSDY